MAHHSPSPSISSASSRRLSELLGEQQEPFYLDLYLLEKGCRSPAAFLDAAACGGGGSACSTCWPRARSIAGGRLLRRTARSKKGRPRGGGGVLRLLLSKILSGTATAPAATTAAKKNRLQPAAIDWRSASVDDEEKQRTAARSMNAGAVPSPRAAVGGHCTEVREEQEEDEEDDESSSKKQLSPVSVLEQRLFEHSSPPHAQKALDLFDQLLEAACTPTTLLHLLANARQYRSCSSSSNRRSTDDDGSSAPATRRRRGSKNGHSNARRRREADVAAFERDLATATTLVASEMASARVRPRDLRPSAQDVGEDIAAAVLDALTEEAAAELAFDGAGPRLCG